MPTYAYAYYAQKLIQFLGKNTYCFTLHSFCHRKIIPLRGTKTSRNLYGGVTHCDRGREGWQKVCHFCRNPSLFYWFWKVRVIGAAQTNFLDKIVRFRLKSFYQLCIIFNIISWVQAEVIGISCGSSFFLSGAAVLWKYKKCFRKSSFQLISMIFFSQMFWDIIFDW